MVSDGTGHWNITRMEMMICVFLFRQTTDHGRFIRVCGYRITIVSLSYSYITESNLSMVTLKH
jgi:hypothetical protein